jgi:hypothetical protein
LEEVLMTRREWFGWCGLPLVARAQQPKLQESITATATYDRTAQIGIVRSDLKDGEEDDGTPFKGLAQPRPVDAELTTEQVAAMVRKAIGFGGMRRGGLDRRIAADDWVVILADADADTRVIAAVTGYLNERHRMKRITILGAAGIPGAEAVPLASAARIELPVPGYYPRSLSIPRIVPECDRLIAIGSLESMAAGNYAALSERPVDDQAMADLFEFHPADYAVVAGTGGRRNVVFAGMNAVTVDAIASAATGRAARYLPALARRGFGETDPDSIWVRGNTLDEAKQLFAGKEVRS